MPVKPWLLEVLPKHLLPPSTTLESDTPFLICISSSATVHMSSPSVVHAQLVPVIPGYYSGVGDLFSALLLGHYHADSNTTHFDDTETPLSVATSLALMKTHTILSETYKHTRTFPEEERHSTDDEMDALDPLRRTRRMRGRELRLVQNQDLIKANKLDADSKRLVPWVGFW
jgi:pyridoxine kinase